MSDTHNYQFTTNSRFSLDEIASLIDLDIFSILTEMKVQLDLGKDPEEITELYFPQMKELLINKSKSKPPDARPEEKEDTPLNPSPRDVSYWENFGHFPDHEV